MKQYSKPFMAFLLLHSALSNGHIAAGEREFPTEAVRRRLEECELEVSRPILDKLLARWARAVFPVERLLYHDVVKAETANLEASISAASHEVSVTYIYPSGMRYFEKQKQLIDNAKNYVAASVVNPIAIVTIHSRSGDFNRIISVIIVAEFIENGDRDDRYHLDASLYWKVLSRVQR